MEYITMSITYEYEYIEYLTFSHTQSCHSIIDYSIEV